MSEARTRYQAWLEVSSETKSLDDLVKEIGEPTWELSHDRDEPGPLQRGRRGCTQWRLALCDRKGRGFDAALADALRDLASSVLPAVTALGDSYAPCVVIGVYFRTADVSVALSPSTTRLIGSFGLGISIACYPCSDEPPG